MNGDKRGRSRAEARKTGLWRKNGRKREECERYAMKMKEGEK